MINRMSIDVIAALRAALHADEVEARRNIDGHGLDGGFPDYRTHVDDDTRAADEYIDRFNPRRVLADIAAKRAVLNLHRPGQRRTTGNGGVIEDCQVCDHFPARYPCTTLRLLAEAYGIRA